MLISDIITNYLFKGPAKSYQKLLIPMPRDMPFVSFNQGAAGSRPAWPILNSLTIHSLSIVIITKLLTNDIYIGTCINQLYYVP